MQRVDPRSADGQRRADPGEPQYVCNPLDTGFEVGDTRTFRFGLEIRDGADTTTGAAKATTGYDNTLEFDDNQANNTAPVTVEVEDAGSATASASASPAGTGNHGNDVRTRTVADVAVTGSLAGTGSSSALPVAGAVGAGALLIGGALVFFVRRRKA